MKHTPNTSSAVKDESVFWPPWTVTHSHTRFEPADSSRSLGLRAPRLRPSRHPRFITAFLSAMEKRPCANTRWQVGTQRRRNAPLCLFISPSSFSLGRHRRRKFSESANGGRQHAAPARTEFPAQRWLHGSDGASVSAALSGGITVTVGRTTLFR